MYLIFVSSQTYVPSIEMMSPSSTASNAKYKPLLTFWIAPKFAASPFTLKPAPLT